ncbi:alpha-2-HS-glycoprotein 2 isoform X2 [Chanos chanos]|uniref:Alpha-2-HS-glycoprotein 2 isoform X2 n=1 Tax=Chanos chanos TaxID=29144 RepID=A0A6J2VIF7_CHACN|nr:alpha-2-HS-glycoprotein-like isoform X2 [Chanos chanos]
MNLLSAVALLGLLLMGTWAQVGPSTTLLSCDSPEAEEAALVAQDYINGQHTHGYKYALNKIEEFKKITKPDGSEVYLMDVELLETKCHVLDPTSVSACPVRPKAEMAVEGDCDVVLSNDAGVFSVVAYKCKSEPESSEELCVGCTHLIPFNDTNAQNLASASLELFNNKTGNATFALLEIGRLASQVVSGGPKLFAEYAIIETNCTSLDEFCVPLNHTTARHGFCLAEGAGLDVAVDCKIFAVPTTVVDPLTNGSVPALPPVVLHAHTAGPGQTPSIHGLRHHKLLKIHDPSVSGLLSESAESAEVLAEPAAPIVKREVPASEMTVSENPNTNTEPQLLMPLCPGKVKHF